MIADAVWQGGLPIEADMLLAEAPPPPFDWVREGTSYWLFEENGAFGIPRNGVEAEPHSWDNRRYQANFAFPDGRILRTAGMGAMPSILDERGRPAVLGGGPITYRCIEPFRCWRVEFDGMCVDTTVADQLALTVDEARQTHLKYAFDLEMAAPANSQDVSPGNFFTWGKGKQRDAVSVGLGWRFEQCLRGEGEVSVDGQTFSARVNGSRIKRRSIRTDGLMLRGHCWQCVVFPDGRAVGYEARPAHPDGFEPWNEGFIWQDGRMFAAKAIKVPWLRELKAAGDDVSFELESELGITRIEGVTGLSTFQISRSHLWGLKLGQSGARYRWDGQEAWGMIERSATPQEDSA